ncbi:hypothetical protein IHE44_0006747 [Lamprotornis superbus]|uniref:Meteorin-like protein n=1 Tax=Lamprotornis superbus TaxID=245042 RepID=A0A835TRK3_9PASS|nr:hypothetical protein IHE44_0006747 [Lamprotornis superbus]
MIYKDASCSRVIRGSIQNVTNEAEEQESIIHVGVNKLYRQKSKVFQLTGETGNWRGQIKTLLECGVKPGDGDFLFTGRMHFGEARLISASPDVLMDQFWAARLFCGFSEQNQSSSIGGAGCALGAHPAQSSRSNGSTGADVVAGPKLVTGPKLVVLSWLW